VQQARFLLSSDTEFTKVKCLAHGIDWKKTFFEYKALLWNDRKPSIRDLLQDLNNKIFCQEQPSTRRCHSFLPIPTSNPEFVSLAARSDEDDEPIAEATGPHNLRSGDLTSQPFNNG
jgi:hypothetical protein